MTITLSIHAQGNILKRALDIAWIEQTILAPDWTTVDPDDSTVIRAYSTIGSFGGRTLRVAYRRRKADILVITAFFDRGARR